MALVLVGHRANHLGKRLAIWLHGKCTLHNRGVSLSRRSTMWLLPCVCSRDECFSETPPITTPISQSPEFNGNGSCDTPRTGSSTAIHEAGGDCLAPPPNPVSESASRMGSHGRNLSDGGGVAQGANHNTHHKRNLSDSQAAGDVKAAVTIAEELLKLQVRPFMRRPREEFHYCLQSD